MALGNSDGPSWEERQERREAMEAGIVTASEFVRALDEDLKLRLIDLGFRSMALTNDDWTREMSQEWRDVTEEIKALYKANIVDSDIWLSLGERRQLIWAFDYGLGCVESESNTASLSSKPQSAFLPH